MILVITGTVSRNFSRLIKEVDRIAGKTDEELVVQIGDTSFRPQNVSYFRFASKEAMEELYRKARVVVSHAGVGTIMTALRYNKPIIVVPRRKEYGELWDDHQVEIAEELAREGKVTVVYDINELKEALNNAATKQVITKKDNRLINSLREYINSISKISAKESVDEA